MKCLLVEDDKYQSLRLKGLLKAHEVRECGTLCEAKSFLSSYSYDIAFIDLDLNGNLEGLELVKIAKENKRKYIYGGSRLSGYHQQKCSIEEYVEMVISRKVFDPVLSKWLSCGMKAGKIIENYFEDQESRNYGVEIFIDCSS